MQVPSGRAQQTGQDLRRQALAELRAQRLASAQAFDLELDADRVNSFPSMAIDSSGNIHIAFDALPDLFNLFALDRSDIFYVRSEDGGNTYTPPVRLNDDATNTTQFLPSLAVNDDGSVAVKWWDRRNDTTHDGLTDVYMTISSDGGRTFGKNFRITDTNWVFGPIERGSNSGYHGDYDAMAGGRSRFLIHRPTRTSSWPPFRSDQTPSDNKCPRESLDRKKPVSHRG